MSVKTLNSSNLQKTIFTKWTWDQKALLSDVCCAKSWFLSTSQHDKREQPRPGSKITLPQGQSSSLLQRAQLLELSIEAGKPRDLHCRRYHEMSLSSSYCWTMLKLLVSTVMATGPPLTSMEEEALAWWLPMANWAREDQKIVCTIHSFPPCIEYAHNSKLHCYKTQIHSTSVLFYVQ
jgi:hypothetical protein